MEGGTAVDGAIAALVCNGAVHSHSMGLGGGFFMTIYHKANNTPYFLNARETAAMYTTEDMFINTTADPKRGSQFYFRLELFSNRIRPITLV